MNPFVASPPDEFAHPESSGHPSTSAISTACTSQDHHYYRLPPIFASQKSEGV
jgi:hypothetical protein